MFVQPEVLYSAEPGLVIGFHGCDERVRDAVVAGREMLWESKNDYDWLGHGFYFWQNNYARALEFARHPPGKPRCENPAVLGAVLSLGNCLDLTDKKYVENVKRAFEELRVNMLEAGEIMPVNKPAGFSGELMLRYLDCSVLECLHAITEALDNTRPYDSVRGVFVEGQPVFEGAGIYDKTHAQICIRNPNCILGFFLPREQTRWP